MTQPPYIGPEPGSPVTKKKGIPGWGVAILAVLGLGAAIVVVLFALGINSYYRFVRAAKTAEARMMLGSMARDAMSAYEAESYDSFGALTTNVLCPSASNPVPADVADIKGRQYMSTPGEWEADKTGNGGFACLNFRMTEPQHYQYDYQSNGKGVGSSFRGFARGDLDGDGVLSNFTIEGRVAAGGVLTLSPSLIETHPDE